MTGKFEHTMDAKGRLFIPAKLREELGASFQIALGSNRDENGEACKSLVLYPKPVWQALEEKINALPSSQAALADVLLAYAAPCEPDSQSRILVPQTLREYAGLGRDVVITGSSNKAKIWDKETWERRSAPQLDPAKVADMFDMLGLPMRANTFCRALGSLTQSRSIRVWPRSRVTKAAARNTTGMWRYWTISVEAGMPLTGRPSLRSFSPMTLMKATSIMPSRHTAEIYAMYFRTRVTTPSTFANAVFLGSLNFSQLLFLLFLNAPTFEKLISKMHSQKWAHETKILYCEQNVNASAKSLYVYNKTA